MNKSDVVQSVILGLVAIVIILLVTNVGFTLIFAMYLVHALSIVFWGAVLGVIVAVGIVCFVCVLAMLGW